MKFITAEEASKKWNIGLRSVQRMCAAGRIEGAEKRSNIWMIPDSASPQRDKKTKDSVSEEEIVEAYKNFVFEEFDQYSNFFHKNKPYESQTAKAYYLAIESYKYYPHIEKMAVYWEECKRYLEKTEVKIPELSLTMGGHLTLGIFLHEAGVADECGKMISERLSLLECLTGRKSGLDLLFQAELAYQRGNIQEAEVLAYRTIFTRDNDPDIKLGVSYILAHISLHKGDVEGWKRASEMIKRVMNESESEIIKTSAEIAKAELLLAVGFTEGVPEWIQKCDFEGRKLTVTTRVNALFVHLSFLWRNGEYARAAAFAEVLLKEREGRQYVSSYSMLYLYMIMALCYNKLYMEECCRTYLKKALEIAKPDRVFLPFAEYSYDLDGYSDEFLRKNEPEIYEKVMKIKKIYRENYVSLNVAIQEPELLDGLTGREKEIVKWVAEGMSNAEIADQLYISKSTVNYHMHNIFTKLGVNRRSMMIKLLYFNDK